MSGLPRISGRVCVKALGKLGFEVRRQRGSHIIMRRRNPTMTVSVPDHRELSSGTLRDIIKAIGLTVDQFKELL